MRFLRGLGGRRGGSRWVVWNGGVMGTRGGVGDVEGAEVGDGGI